MNLRQTTWRNLVHSVTLDGDLNWACIKLEHSLHQKWLGGHISPKFSLTILAHLAILITCLPQITLLGTIEIYRQFFVIRILIFCTFITKENTVLVTISKLIKIISVENSIILILFTLIRTVLLRDCQVFSILSK